MAMKRGILLMMMLIFLADVAEDGYPGSAASGPVPAAVSQAGSRVAHHLIRPVDALTSVPASQWRGLPRPRPAAPAIPLGHRPLTILTSCNHGDAGGIPG
jgi:hypothetical protein